MKRGGVIPPLSSCHIYDMTILIEKEKCNYDEE